jgi:chromate reductase
VLKNAIDWVSRHPSKPFQRKLTAVIGASLGRLGSARAQYHFRQIAVFIDLDVLNRPEIMVAEANTKFDATGKLLDTGTEALLKRLIVAIRDRLK